MQVTQYLGYASLKDFFPTMDIRANPGCLNPLCVRLQAAYKVGSSPAYSTYAVHAVQSARKCAMVCVKFDRVTADNVMTVLFPRMLHR